jgi:hypothetical protein
MKEAAESPRKGECIIDVDADIVEAPGGDDERSPSQSSFADAQPEVEAGTATDGQHPRLVREKTVMQEQYDHFMTWSYQLTQSYQSRDPDLEGLALQVPSQAPEWGSLPDDAGKARRALYVCCMFPGHFICELRFLFLPLMFAVVAPVTVGYITSMQADAVPEFTKGTMAELTFDPRLPSRLALMNVVSFNMVQIGFWGYYISLIGVLWSWTKMRSIVLYHGLPAAVVSFLIKGFYGVMPQYDLTGRISRLVYGLMMLWMLGGCGHVMLRAGNATRSHMFGVLGIGSTCLAMVIVFLYRSMAGTLFAGSDEIKALFIAVVNPVIFEFGMILPNRFLARAISTNHPSTAFLIVGMAISFKQAMGRTVMAMVKSPTWVLVLSMLSALGEVFLRVTMKARDHALYRAVFGRFLANGEDPDAQLNSVRNSHMRANNSMYETMSELTFIWNGVAIVYFMDILVNDGTPLA